VNATANKIGTKQNDEIERVIKTNMEQ